MSSIPCNLGCDELESNAERAEEIDIGIVGGGLAGLALALALQERNIPCHVFESHPPSKSADTASIVGIGLNGITALEGIKLGLTTTLAQAGVYSTKTKFVTFTGTEVTTVQEIVPGKLIILTWKSLHRVLDSFVSRSRISFSHKLLAYKPCKGGVEAYFKCPKESTGDHRIKVVPCKLLIGADGIWSAVRKQMVGDAPRYLKMRTWSALVHDPHLKLFDGLEKGDFIVQREKRTNTAMVISNSGDYTLWSVRKMDQTEDMTNSVLADRTTRGRPGCKQHALQQLDGIELCDDLRNAIELTSEEIIIERKTMDRLPLNKWSDADGHVLLIGDAAHAQYIGPGQGAVSAFEDVHQLSLLLEMASESSFSEGSIQEAVKRSLMFPKSYICIEISNLNFFAVTVLTWDNFFRSFGNLSFRTLGYSTQYKRLQICPEILENNLNFKAQEKANKPIDFFLTVSNHCLKFDNYYILQRKQIGEILEL